MTTHLKRAEEAKVRKNDMGGPYLCYALLGRLAAGGGRLLPANSQASVHLFGGLGPDKEGTGGTAEFGVRPDEGSGGQLQMTHRLQKEAEVTSLY